MCLPCKKGYLILNPGIFYVMLLAKNSMETYSKFWWAQPARTTISKIFHKVLGFKVGKL